MNNFLSAQENYDFDNLMGGKTHLKGDEVNSLGRPVIGPILKNRFYYRNEHNQWNNHYLVPIQKRKVSGIRLDLDHFARLQQQKRKEADEEKHQKFREQQRDFRGNQLLHFSENKTLNNMADFSRGGGIPKPPVDNRFRDTYIVKDNKYYHNMNQDYSSYIPNLPPNRVDLTYNKTVLKNENDMVRCIDRRIKADNLIEDGHIQWKKIARLDTLQKFDKRKQLRETFESKIYPDKRYSRPQSMHHQRTERVDCLALPKQMFQPINKFDRSEYAGLLATNPDLNVIVDTLVAREKLKSRELSSRGLRSVARSQSSHYSTIGSRERIISRPQSYDPSCATSTQQTPNNQGNTLSNPGINHHIKQNDSVITSPMTPISSLSDKSTHHYVSLPRKRSIRVLPSYWSAIDEFNTQEQNDQKRKNYIEPHVIQSYTEDSLVGQFG